jgi:hypothetical protein
MHVVFAVATPATEARSEGLPSFETASSRCRNRGSNRVRSAVRRQTRNATPLHLLQAHELQKHKELTHPAGADNLEKPDLLADTPEESAATEVAQPTH